PCGWDQLVRSAGSQPKAKARMGLNELDVPLNLGQGPAPVAGSPFKIGSAIEIVEVAEADIAAVGVLRVELSTNRRRLRRMPDHLHISELRRAGVLQLGPHRIRRLPRQWV